MSTRRWPSTATRSASRSRRPRRSLSQRVRARFIPVGGAGLELLEATSADSAIARYLARRGPGLHHVTLRVEDIRAALAHLASRGVRLVDEQPRPGAEGALVAFIHPSAAHGVLIELKQAAASVDLTVRSMPFGDLRLSSLHDGPFRLDGGAMFGVVPRPLWEKLAPPDDRHRIQLAMRPAAGRGRVGSDADRLRRRRQDERQAARHLRPRSHADARQRAGRSRADGGVDRHRAADAPALRSLRRRHHPRRCRPAAAVREGDALHSRRRMGGRHPSARAQPRQLPAGRLSSR